MRARTHLNIGGQKRFLKFTVSTLYRYDENIGQDGAALNLILNSPMTALLNLTHLALNFDGNENKLPEDFSKEMVADWIDDLNKADLEKLVNTMMVNVKKYGAAFSSGE